MTARMPCFTLRRGVSTDPASGERSRTWASGSGDLHREGGVGEARGVDELVEALLLGSLTRHTVCPPRAHAGWWRHEKATRILSRHPVRAAGCAGVVLLEKSSRLSWRPSTSVVERGRRAGCRAVIAQVLRVSAVGPTCRRVAAVMMRPGTLGETTTSRARGPPPTTP